MEEEACAMTDNRRCSLGAAGLAFVTGGLLGAAMALLLARSLVVNRRSNCVGMRGELKRVCMAWPTRPRKVWNRC